MNVDIIYLFLLEIPVSYTHLDVYKRQLHGHRWRVIAEIYADSLYPDGQLRGMVTDFGDIKQDLKVLADFYDHALIAEEGTLKPVTVKALEEEDFRIIWVPFRPTAENFSRHFYTLLKEKGYQDVYKRQVLYDFVEVMACPGGCVNGGGQPQQLAEISNVIDIRSKRADSLYKLDSCCDVRKSYENSAIKELYKSYLGEPGSKKAQQYLSLIHI